MTNSIEIDAPASAVWKVLTDPAMNKQWISLWWPGFDVLETDWKTGSTMQWKVEGGIVGADGKVLENKPNALLRFLFSAKVPDFEKTETMTWTLTEKGGRTVFDVSMGDFGDSPEHEACYPGAVEAWEMSLPKIRGMVEKSRIKT